MMNWRILAILFILQPMSHSSVWPLLSHFPREAPSVIVMLVVLSRGGVTAVLVVQPEMPEARLSSSLFFSPTQHHTPPSETSQAPSAQMSRKCFISSECAFYLPDSSHRLRSRLGVPEDMVSDQQPPVSHLKIRASHQ